MRVIKENVINEDTVGNLEYGDLFEYNGKQYLLVKLEKSFGSYARRAAVDLVDNCVCLFEPDCLVKLITGTFFYKYIM